MYPVECVARGYLTGSGLLDYRRHRRGLRHRAAGRPPGRLPAPRADLHARHQGRPRRPRRERRLRGGRRGRRRRRGRRAADAHHGGLRPGPRARPRRAASSWPTPRSSSARGADGTTVLADEVLTPDSSRFWPADEWQPGRAQPSYDKQIVRDWLTSPESGWDRTSGEAAAAAAARGRRAHPLALRRGLRAADRGDVLTGFRATVELPVPRGGGLRLPRPTRATGRSGSRRCARSRCRPTRSRTWASAGRRRPSVGVRPRLEIVEMDPPHVWTERGWWRGVEATLSLRFARTPRGCRVEVSGDVGGRGLWAVPAAVAGRLAGIGRRRRRPQGRARSWPRTRRETTGDARHDR